MTTYLTRTLTSHSYMIGAIVQKVFTRVRISSYTNHCGASSPETGTEMTNHCGQPIGGDYGGHC